MFVKSVTKTFDYYRNVTSLSCLIWTCMNDHCTITGSSVAADRNTDCITSCIPPEIAMKWFQVIQRLYSFFNV